MRRTLGLLALGLVTATAAIGCKDPEVKGSRGRTVKATIAEFDPNAVMDLNLGDGGGGGERPDDYEVQQKFNDAFGGMDECVAKHKEKKGMSSDAQLPGDLSIAVKLNPKKGTPLGVNATLPGKLDRETDLKDCIRDAVATVHFPTYDGPPIVAEFETQLDAGSEWEDE
jgi:hypothetical protein